MTLSHGRCGAGMGTGGPWACSVRIGRDLEGQELDPRAVWIGRGLGELIHGM